MKNKLHKILGVGLTLAVLASLMIAAIPTSASTLSWGSEKDPAHSDYKNLLSPAANINITDVAANGDVVFASTDSTAYPLFKSTDGGANWYGLENSESFPEGESVTAVAVSPDDPDVVAIITSNTTVEYSSDGGSSWTRLPACTDTNPAVTASELHAIAIAPGSTPLVVVGGSSNTSNQAELFTLSMTLAQTWQARYTSGTGDQATAGPAAGQTDIIAVAVSPNYTTDKAITVVTNNGTQNTGVFQIWRNEEGDRDWNDQIGYLDSDWAGGVFLDWASTEDPTGGLAVADIALPSTYLANDEGGRMAYVATGGLNGGGGITRLTDVVQANFDTWSGGGLGPVGSLALHEDGWMVAGSYDDNQVFQYLSLSGTSPDATRINTLKQPGGSSNTQVALAGDTVIAGTAGDESAISQSSDQGYSFNDVALIDTTLGSFDDFDISADGSIIYLATSDADGGANTDTSLWRKADSTWKRVLSLKDQTNEKLLVRLAPEDADAVYIAANQTENVWVSKNGGMESWKSVPAYPVTTVQDLEVESADVAYALDSAAGSGVSKTTNGGASWGKTQEPTEGIKGYDLYLAPNGDILVGDKDGYIAFSKDGGSTFERTVDFGTPTAGRGPVIAADADYENNNTIYVGIGDDVKRRTVTTSTAAASTRGENLLGGMITGIAHVDGVTYVLSSDGTNNYLYQTSNLLNASDNADAEWTYDMETGGEDYRARLNALKVSTGSVKLWTIDLSGDLDSFTDTVSLDAPTMSAPDDGDMVAINTASGKAYDITFIFLKADDSDVSSAQLQIATDSDFNAIVHDAEYTGLTKETVARVIGPATNDGFGLVEYLPGSTYYWRVRTTTPVNSPWSETRSFTVEGLGGSPFQLTGPSIGGGDVSVNPVLTWGPYPDAIRYEVSLSEDPSFAILEWSHNVDNLFYAVSDSAGETLDYGTTYYWRVRGVTGESYTSGKSVITPAGPWITGVFTTMAEPTTPEVVEKTVTVTETAPAKVTAIEIPGPTKVIQQSIPNWMLLTIIIIGVVLIIALIILIVRTRRVA